MAKNDYYEKNKARILEQNRLYRLENPEKRKQQHRDDLAKHGEKRRAKQAEWRASNPDKLKEGRRRWFQKNKQAIYEKRKSCAWTPEKQAEYIAKYQVENKDRIRERLARYKETNPQYYIRHRLRGRVGAVMRRAKDDVPDRHIDCIGCARSFFLKHIESLFKEGMTWENYGKGGWEIDHKIPCSAFDLTIEEDQLKCFHYTNLQPLWWRENIQKGKKILQEHGV